MHPAIAADQGLLLVTAPRHGADLSSEACSASSAMTIVAEDGHPGQCSRDGRRKGLTATTWNLVT